MNRRRQILTVALAVSLAGGALGVMTVGSGAVTASPSQLDWTSPASEIGSSVPADVGSAFAALRTTRGPGDELPAAAQLDVGVTGGLGKHFGINPTLSRFAGDVDGQGVWLIPGSTGTCMWIAAYGLSCAPNATAASQGLTVVLVPVAGGASIAIGILPDGASLSATNGDGTLAPVADAGALYSVRGDATATTVSVDSANGGVSYVTTLSADNPPTPGPGSS